MNAVAATIRKTFGRTSVESFAREKLVSVGKQLEDHFHVLDGVFYESAGSSKKLKVTHRPMIMAKDCNLLINEILLTRDIDSPDCLVKIGVDGGQGFFKVCLTICDSQGEAKTEHGAAAGGVKGLLILAMVPNIGEIHSNVATVFEEMNISFINNAILCADLKLANMIVGIGAHSSTYPCLYCESSPRDEWSTAPLRTFGRIRDLARRRNAAAEGLTEPSEPRFFKSVQNDPLIQCGDHTTVLEKVPPPELHLLMGTVNHIYKQMQPVRITRIHASRFMSRVRYRIEYSPISSFHLFTGMEWCGQVVKQLAHTTNWLPRW